MSGPAGSTGEGREAGVPSRAQSLCGDTEGTPSPPSLPHSTQALPSPAEVKPEVSIPAFLQLCFHYKIGMKWQYLGFLRKGNAHCFAQLAKPSSQTALNSPRLLVLSDSCSTENSGSWRATESSTGSSNKPLQNPSAAGEQASGCQGLPAGWRSLFAAQVCHFRRVPDTPTSHPWCGHASEGKGAANIACRVNESSSRCREQGVMLTQEQGTALQSP